MNKIVRAYLKGYRVNTKGEVISHVGNTLSLFKRGGKGKDGDGYLGFGFRYGDKKISCTVHRLQAFQKFGMKLFEEGVVARHLNGDAKDNSWSNIGIGTASDNMMDMSSEVRMKKALHATSFVRKYDKDDVRKFHRENGSSYKKTMEKFDIKSKGSLHYVLNNNK